MTSAAGMPCPVCRVSLVMSERQGVEIDYCPQCRGVWLDRGELDKIIERSAQDAPPLLQYSSLPFQSRSMIRATIGATLSPTGMAISTVIPSGRSPFSRSYSIETLRRMNGKGPVTGPFVCGVRRVEQSAVRSIVPARSRSCKLLHVISK